MSLLETSEFIIIQSLSGNVSKLSEDIHGCSTLTILVAVVAAFPFASVTL